MQGCGGSDPRGDSLVAWPCVRCVPAVVVGFFPPVSCGQGRLACKGRTIHLHQHPLAEKGEPLATRGLCLSGRPPELVSAVGMSPLSCAPAVSQACARSPWTLLLGAMCGSPAPVATTDHPEGGPFILSPSSASLRLVTIRAALCLLPQPWVGDCRPLRLREFQWSCAAGHLPLCSLLL